VINKEVIPAFEMLLDELEAIIPELNKNGKLLLDEKRYDEAHNLINKAQAVVAFQTKVRNLRDEWVNMNVPPTKTPPKRRIRRTPKKGSRTVGPRLEEGKRTKNEDFHIPILQVLVKNGGRTTYSELIDELTRDLADTLNKFDWEFLPDGHTIRWKNNVGWAKKPLKDAGLISTTAPDGIWEITDAGRRMVEESKKKAT
jgi:exonuclease VII small subunit